MRYLLFVLFLTGCGQTSEFKPQLHSGLYDAELSYMRDDWGLGIASESKVWDLTRLSDDKYELSINGGSQKLLGFKQDDVISFFRAKIEPCGTEISIETSDRWWMGFLRAKAKPSVTTSIEINIRPSNDSFIGSEKSWVGFCGGGGMVAESILFGRLQQ